MKQSQLFTKTRKEAPKDEVSRNAELLIRAGYIHKEMAGVYSYLPLGLRVFNKIENIIREEMNTIGGQEISMTTLQDPDIWKASGRWDDAVVDNWFKTKVKAGGDVGMAFTHEEPISRIMSSHVRSYKDLPFSAYQFQTKFRNEQRAKSGILRGREFVMKDMYSFCRNEDEHLKFYETAKKAYFNIFERAGLGDRTFITFASGGSFSQFSHEFQTICDAGEDTIYVSEQKKIAVNKEVMSPITLTELDLSESDLVEKKSIEVGNIFTLGTKFSEALGLSYLDEKGAKNPVFMGCYGIGIGRLMGTVVEVFADEKGIVWPEAIAPFQVHLISLTSDNANVLSSADSLYKILVDNGVEVLYDDRNVRAGEKFADSDLLGLPVRLVVSDKTLSAGGIEFKRRTETESKIIGEKEIARYIAKQK